MFNVYGVLYFDFVDCIQKPGYPGRSIFFLKSAKKLALFWKQSSSFPTFVILINFILFLVITGCCSWMYTFHRYFNAFQFWRLKSKKRLKEEDVIRIFHVASLFTKGPACRHYVTSPAITSHREVVPAIATFDSHVFRATNSATLYIFWTARWNHEIIFNVRANVVTPPAN